MKHMEVGNFYGELILRGKKTQTKTTYTHVSSPPPPQPNRKASKPHYSRGGPFLLITELLQSDIVSV